MNTQLTDNEALELKALIAPSYSELAEIEDLEKVKQYLLELRELQLIARDFRILPESIGKLTQLTKLDLNQCYNISTLPESIEKLTQLQELDLSQCDKLNKLPESIGNLTQLKRLYLCDCENFEIIPDSIGNLTQLTNLDLSSSDITELPERIGKLTKLTELNLYYCQNLKMLPESIGNLIELTELNLSCCEKLKKLPENIGNLTQLNYLSLHLCRSLVSIPESIGKLVELIELDLSWCVDLIALPESICNLKQLEKLNLRGCDRLKILPAKICELEQLKTLEILDCDEIKYFPEYIGNMKSLKELLCNYKNIEKLPLSFTQLKNLKENYLRLALNEINKITKDDDKIKLLDILLCVLKTREELIVKYDFFHTNQNYYEQFVAHYTRPDIAIKLLEKDEQGNSKQNPFQMGSIAQVNDPSEGKVIFDYFNELNVLKNNNVVLKPASTLATFVGCFTFNHDSLNQFRLYGKEQGKEATGVSIVLKNNFFTSNHSNSSSFLYPFLLSDELL